MPRPEVRVQVRRPKSLVEMSVYSVARHLAYNYNPDQVKVETLTSEHVEDGEKSVSKRSKCAYNPFEELPSHLLQKVTDLLNTAIVRPDIKYFDLLLTKQTRKLQWECKNESEAVTLLQLAAIKCPQLSVLSLGARPTGWFKDSLFSMERIPDCSLECYHNVLPQFKHIQVLEVEGGTHFDDSCLWILGIHCKDLRELNVLSCQKITDDGIAGICGDVTDTRKSEIPVGQGGGCKSLQKLVIASTKVTQSGVKMALRHLPRLKILESPHIIEALASLNQNGSFRPECNLTKLRLWSDVWAPYSRLYRNDSVSLAASLCPFVTHLHISVLGLFTDSDLLGLVVLKNLCYIKIALDHYPDGVTFDRGLAPFLKAVGSSVKFLDIKMPISLHLDCFMEYCPNLERLSLNCKFSASAWGGEPASLVWKNLKELELVQARNVRTANSLFSALASAPALRRLSLTNFDNLDDTTLQNVFQYHSFEYLEELAFNSCPTISERGIDLFLTEGNSLKKIVLFYCRSLSREDVEFWRQKGVRNDWDLKIVYGDQLLSLVI